MNKEEIEKEIKTIILSLASENGVVRDEISSDEIIPHSGYLDSSAIVKLILDIENKYSLTIEEEELTLSNLGTVNSIVSFIINKKS